MSSSSIQFPLATCIEALLLLAEHPLALHALTVNEMVELTPWAK
jgi:hypothetical protein